MKLSEYKNIFDHEETHFIYQSSHYNILSLVQKYVSNSEKKRILDAGCGTGYLMVKLAKLGEVYGIDVSPEAIKYCKKRGQKNVLVGSVTNLPFKPNTFDVIVTVDVLYHKQVNDLVAFKQFFRVLKPGGILVVKVPAHNWLRGKHDAIAHTKHRFELSEVKSKLRKTGFKILFASWGHLSILPFAVIKRFIDSISENEGETDVKDMNPIVNNLIVWISKLETKLMLLSGLPNGLSVYAVGQKPRRKDKSKRNLSR